MDVSVGLWRKLNAKELMLLNCGAVESLESPLDCKEIQPVHSEGDQPWDFFERTDAKAESPVLRPPHVKSWFIGKTLMLRGIGGRRRRVDRGWDGWMASRTWWTWVWVNSGRWWWTGRPGVLRFMGPQRVGHDWATELNWGNSKPAPPWKGLRRNHQKQVNKGAPYTLLKNKFYLQTPTLSKT